jgi:hypothetical protein
MKYSQHIGIAAAAGLMIICFLPWIYVPALGLTLNGVNGTVNEQLTFGRQVVPHSLFCILAILLFSIPRVWAKRVNIFVAFLNMGWAIKNYILFSICRQGICPELKPALYLLVFFAIIMQLASLLPKMSLPPSKQ